MPPKCIRIERVCQQCGAAFSLLPSVAAIEGHGQFCSIPCYAKARKRDEVARFWSKVDKSGPCWLWTASTTYGYGSFRINKRTALAHRYSYQLANGDIPDGMNVLHDCDNPACVNPAHLRLGTKADNTYDMMDKSRQQGCCKNNQKLTAGQAAAIRARYVPGRVTMKSLAEEYGVSVSAICLIVHRRNWRRV